MEGNTHRGVERRVRLKWNGTNSKLVMQELRINEIQDIQLLIE
jgi:hypothetical protein